MRLFKKKRDTIHLDDAGAREFIHGMGERLGRALDDKIMKALAQCRVQIRTINEQVKRLQHMMDAIYEEAYTESSTEKEIRPDADGAKERAYCTLESAMICLHTGQPLFFPFKEMSEYNAILRRELIMALLLALDLLRQNGVSVEQTAQVEKIRREYTSAQ